MTAGEAPAGGDIEIFVDADACPVKDEIYRVAFRYGLPVRVVANSFINVPRDPLITRTLVGRTPDAADDWIAERAGPRSLVVTQDIHLAARCVARGAAVLSPQGRRLTEDSVGMAVATRDLMTRLRDSGARTRGPPPLSKQDRSRFLSAMDTEIVRLQRG